MFQAGAEKILYVIVRQGIEYLLSGAVEGDDVMLSKNLQLMGNPALGEGKDFGNIIDAKLVFQKKGNDRKPRRVREYGIERRQRIDGLLRQEFLPDIFDCLGFFHISIIIPVSSRGIIFLD